MFGDCPFIKEATLEKAFTDGLHGPGGGGKEGGLDVIDGIWILKKLKNETKINPKFTI